jgi:hypothetical protein
MGVRKATSTTTKKKPQAKRAKRRVPSSIKRLAAIGDRVPDRALVDVPTDSARNVDHYLYGAPKQP